MSLTRHPHAKMTRPSRAPRSLAPFFLPLLSLVAPAAHASQLSPPATSTLAIVERTLAQDQGGWLVEYRLRYQGSTGMVVTPTEILLKLESWVSNSRVAAHAVPRLSSLVISGGGPTATADVVIAADDAQRCRERASIQVWTDEPSGDADTPPPPAPSGSARGSAATPSEPKQPVLSLVPGTVLRVRLKLEHLHFLHGDYDPLLGARALELHLGAAILRDALPLDREQYLAQAKYTWPAPPEDRRDPRHFLSGPDSLHLEAHVPGNQYYRFPERPIRYATRMRLRYWYYIAAGTEGDCRARVAQYKDTPSAWKVLSEGGHEECLSTVGRWVKVERIFRTEADATTLALDFRITGQEIGEMWVDDLTLEPLSGQPPAGP